MLNHRPDSRPLLAGTALRGAATMGHEAAVLHLLACPEIEVDLQDQGTGSTPLHSAALGGYVGIIDKLVAASADVQATDGGPVWEGGWTPLHHAAKGGSASAVELRIGLKS